MIPRVDALLAIRPPRSGWFVALRRGLNRWHERRGTIPFLEVLASACDRQLDWLYHPSMTVWLDDSGPDMDRRLLQAYIWIARHVKDAAFQLNLSRSYLVWTEAGGVSIPTFCDFSDLGLQTITEPSIDLDPWSLCSGTRYADTWHIDSEWNETLQLAFRHSIEVASSGLETLREALQDLYAWVLYATRIVVPRIPNGTNALRSESREDQIGTVYVDAPTVSGFLEAVVHESAHQHFYLMELSNALVANPKAAYYSPLKKRARPVRGVFLAFHALLFMRAYYQIAIESQIDDLDVLRREAEVVDADLGVACESMYAARSDLTDYGRQVVDELFRSMLTE
jgi:hypothetical protein